MEAQLTEVTEVRQRDREATRRRLLEAARGLFGEYGYEQVTVRMIASAADANIALVGRYFGSKAGLFGEVLAGEPTVRAVVEGDRAGLPRRLAAYAAARMSHGPESPVLRSLEGAAGDPEVQQLVRDRLSTVVIEPMAAMIGGPDAHARARMAASVFLGVGSMRRLVGPRTATPADVERLTAVFELCLGLDSD
ncbi:TetR/AcrR family transcriptional regulator [Nonomuraea rhizosphaerae]|uniref:TetR/AcrR family transcriptional regulator n=1 Tax=Nonomuraea rhizosphaerae TaxID=2665663 RepID=UPI001C5EFE24|nr:TetR/AcrR family transcriptional regulator [Nonomuraea rhizosphaerae]